MSDAILVPEMVGAPLSKVQLNCVAALLLFPDASVKVLPATSIVVAPFDEGVKFAVYMVPLPENEAIEPPLTVISANAKLVVVSLLVKVTTK